MAETAAKRAREARKRRQREIKAERKRLRKDGLLTQENPGWFPPGELPRQTVD